MIDISFIACISYILGLLTYSKVNISTAVIVLSLLLIFVIIQKKRNKMKSTCILIAIVFFIGGFLSMLYKTDLYFKNLYKYSGEYVTLTGYIDSIPTRTSSYNGYMHVDKITYDETTVKTNERIFVSCDKNIEYSQKVKISGFIEEVPPKNNRYDYDYKRYFMTKNVYFQMFADDVVATNKRPILSISYPANLVKIEISKIIDKLYPSYDASLVKCILLGNKSYFTESEKETLYQTGVMSTLYSGYLHILLITFLINLSYCIFDKKKRKKIITCVLLVYIMFNTENVTPIRNAILVLMLYSSINRKGYYYYPTLLCQSIIVVLLFNPTFIYSANFVISYSMGIMLFMVMEPLVENFTFIKNATLRRVLICLFISSIGMAPILAYFYSQRATYSFIIIFVCYPLVIFTIISSIIGILEFLIFSKGLLFTKITKLLLFAIKGIVYGVDKIPFHYYDVAQSSVAVIIIFFLSFLLIRLITVYGIKDIKTKVCYIACIAMMLSIFAQNVLLRPDVEICFVNVKMADGSYIRMPGGEIITVDGGGKSSYTSNDTGEKMFLPYLKREGIYEIDLAVVSHYHDDHALGTIALLKELKVKSVLLPDIDEENPLRLEIENLCHEKNVKVTYASDGQKIEFLKNANIEVISSGNNGLVDENDNSMMFYVKYKDFSALFTGDSGVAEEEKYMDKFRKTDVLKVAHHGSVTSTSQEFLDKVSPKACVISVGKDNYFTLPSKTILRRIKESKIKLFRTDKNGDIKIRYKNGKITKSILR